MPLKNKMNINTQVKGVSLIEVLIALVILSIGLLATAAMQMKALQNTSNSEYRTQAINLVMDMADKMQANYGEVLKDAATTPYDPTVNRCSGDATCLRAQSEYINYLVPDDINTWVGQVRAALPDGNAIICRDSDHDLFTNDIDSDADGSIDNNDDPCDSTAANICDVAGTANDFSPYVVRVCWTESGGRRDVDGDGDIDENDRIANQIIKNTRILLQFSATVQ